MAFVGKWIGLGTSQGASSQNTAGTGQEEDLSKDIAITKPEYKQFGLENFGNTCYANSVLQALYFCHPFRELVIQAPDRTNPVDPVVFSPTPPPPTITTVKQRVPYRRKDSTSEVRQVADAPNHANQASTDKPAGPAIPAHPPTMFSALRALFVHIAHNNAERGIATPRAFIDKLKKENENFRTPMHQDAHEFLNFLLNKVSEDLEEEVRHERSRTSSGDDLSNSVTSSAGPSTLGTNTPSNAHCLAHSTLVQDLFEGVLTSETRCLTCETISSRDEAFLDLSIDIEQNSSVTACLRQFSASEMLCQKNKFFCDSCCGLQEAEKRMKIKRLPNVLALHLKRFKFHEDVQKYIKLTYRVAFPLELRLFNTADDAQDPDRLYELFAIVVHIGNGPNHGHYIAIVKSRDAWVVFDDDAVDTIKESDISRYFGDSNSGSAYVLYYQAIDLDLAALGLRTADPPADSVPESSSLSAPIVPPSLTHEGDSDASDTALLTPASAMNGVVSAPRLSNTPPLSLSIPSPESTPKVPLPTTSPIGQSPVTVSRRQSLSKSAAASRHSLYSSTEPVPPLPTPLSPKLQAENSKASSSSSPSTAGTVSGKKSGGGWFKRRSFKAVERPAESNLVASRSSRPATSHGQPDRPDDASFVSSSTSSRAGKVPDSSTPKKMSDTSSPIPKQPNGRVHDSGRQSQDESISIDEASSSHGFETAKEAHSPDLSSSLDPSHHEDPPTHKETRSPPGLNLAPPIRPSRSSKRPSTASASLASPDHGSFRRADPQLPTPPIPSSFATLRPRGQSTTVRGAPSDVKDGAVPRRDFVLAASLPPPTSLKRPSRKLSFTSAMLGFVKKDKDKDKQKERDNNPGNLHNSHSPSSLPGMSTIGRL